MAYFHLGRPQDDRRYRQPPFSPAASVWTAASSSVISSQVFSRQSSQKSSGQSSTCTPSSTDWTPPVTPPSAWENQPTFTNSKQQITSTPALGYLVTTQTARQHLEFGNNGSGWNQHNLYGPLPVQRHNGPVPKVIYCHSVFEDFGSINILNSQYLTICPEYTTVYVQNHIKKSLWILSEQDVVFKNSQGEVVTPSYANLLEGDHLYIVLRRKKANRPLSDISTINQAQVPTDGLSKHLKSLSSANNLRTELSPSQFSLTSTHCEDINSSLSPLFSPDRTTNSSVHNSISSEGEASFIGSVDSDEFADVWESALDPSVRSLRARLVDDLVTSFEGLAHGDDVEAQDTNTPSSSSRQTSDSASQSGNATKSSATSLGKRQRDLNGTSSESNGQFQTPDRKGRRGRASLMSFDGRLLACPYCKFDPIRYSEANVEEKNYRGCSSCYLTSISRLKQHLYRVHKRPDHHCVSCFDIFDSKDMLDAHTRARPPCELQDPQFSEKMTFEQCTLVKRRAVCQNQSETWFAIYEILFPGSPRPASAYADSVSPEMVQSFIDHFNRRARARLLDLVHIELDGRLLLSGDQQRILDSALEAALARLVSQDNIGASDSGSQSPNVTEAISSPLQSLPLSSLPQESSITLHQRFTQPNFSHTTRSIPLAPDAPPWTPFYPSQDGDLFGLQEVAYSSTMNDFESGLPNLPHNGFFDHNMG
jgi:hypothetical protein